MQHTMALWHPRIVAKRKIVVFIPDCRECMKRPVSYIQSAMVGRRQTEAQGSYGTLYHGNDCSIFLFFNRTTEIVFVIDQHIKALEPDKEKDDLRVWLSGFSSRHKAVLSSSANYTFYVKTEHQQSNQKTLHVHGGFTMVSLSKNE
jgi:hypothetical protein